ncbi:MAG: molybdenum cofactor biosynthesis protein MoaB [Bacteroidota bacterium]|nr:molybdenum cofactor biosynthesis protein MoaB [Bacteroidota bacterium]
MSHTDHQKAGASLTAACAVITCSDTRTTENDASGDRIAALLTEAGHIIVSRVLIPDDAERIRAAVQDALQAGARIVITTGGTGISRRDTTFEALQGMITTDIPGFGELFRVLSYEEIGPAAMMSRALAGLVQESVLFALPGSRNAVELAMQRLILPQIGHFLAERSK